MSSKLVVSLLSRDQEFQALQASEAERAAQRFGLQAEVVYARNNSKLQVEQLYRFIHAPEATRPVAIIVHAVGGEELIAVARDAAKAGIGWIVLNRDVTYIDTLRSEFPRLPIGIVSTDQHAIGRIQGQQLRRFLPSGGNVLYIQGPADTTAAQQRRTATEAELKATAIKLAVLEGNWTEASGEEAVTSWLRLSSSQSLPLQAVAAQNDAMAMGARKAMAKRKPEYEKLPFVGCDGVPDAGKQFVDAHQLTATVVVQSNTGPAIELIAGHLQKGQPVGARLILQPHAYPR